MTRRPAAVALLALSLLASGCAAPPEEPADERSTPRVRVQVAPARRADLQTTLEVTGEVDALRVLRLSSPVAGRVTFLAAQPGDRVARGDTVVRVLPLETEVALDGFAILEGTAGLSGEERQAKARLESGRGEVALRAPFDALVSDRARNPGEQVAPGDVLVELFDPRSLDVLAQVPLAQSRRVSPGMPARITADGVAWTGRVSGLHATLTAPALTLPVRVALAEPPARPLLHAPVRCEIATARHHHAVVVPRAALVSLRSSGRGAVVVASGDVAVRRAVVVGARTEREVEIRRGLAEGELVITDGGYGLPEGTPIEPVVTAP